MPEFIVPWRPLHSNDDTVADGHIPTDELPTVVTAPPVMESNQTIFRHFRFMKLKLRGDRYLWWEGSFVFFEGAMSEAYNPIGGFKPCTLKVEYEYYELEMETKLIEFKLWRNVNESENKFICFIKWDSFAFFALFLIFCSIALINQNEPLTLSSSLPFFIKLMEENGSFTRIDFIFRLHFFSKHMDWCIKRTYFWQESYIFHRFKT